MGDNWNIYRIGKAAAATTAPGQIPQYGLAYDLGTAQWASSQQFNTAVRDFSRTQATQQITQATTTAQAVADEMAMADSYQKYGVGLTAGEMRPINELTSSPGDRNILSGFVHDEASGIMGAFNSAKGGIRTGFSKLFGGDGSGDGAPAYDQYKAKGGLLAEADFNNYDPDTQSFLIQHLDAMQNLGDVLETPGVKHVLAGINAGYRGLQTPFILASQQNAFSVPGIDPNWYQTGSWAEAWRESQDQSLGNAIVNSVIQPYVGHDRVDEWRKDSSLYQLTSLGVELGASWYADPGVIAGKTVGAAARLGRGEMPLSETGSLYRATRQSLQREQITVGGPVGQLGKWRAKTISNRWEDVAAFARSHSYQEFSDLPMFRKRDLDGQSGAAALYYAYRESPADPGQVVSLVPEAERTYSNLEDLTQQLMVGDPKAYRQLDSMKKATPEELQKFAPGAQTYIDAIESTKTKITQLQKEADDLAKLKTYSPFHEWSVHTEVDQRFRDIAEANDQLAKYQGYTDWLGNAMREPDINRVHSRHFFLDNPYGRPHIVQRMTRPLWIQKANVMPMHDLDLGAESIRRQFLQFEHLMGYTNPEAADKALLDWQNAPTAFDRYQVATNVEEHHLIEAAAQHFGADPEVIRDIYRKVITEQNKVYEGIRKGQGSVYSTAPDVAARLRAGENIGLVSHDPDTGMVTLELMDNGKRVTTTVHESALEPKTSPVDPTQTPNYYQPIDTRRFYLELKRNQEIVTDMSAARAAGAATADLIDTVGTRFNALWKPLQLFRFGWPQRVLMDENTRALAILGIPGFVRYYAPDYYSSGMNAVGKVAHGATAPVRKGLTHFQKKQINGFNDLVDLSISNPTLAAKYGRERLPLGPGPVVDDVLRSDPIKHDLDLLNAPRVPEPWMPVADTDRVRAINKHIADWDAYDRALTKHQMWVREYRTPEAYDALESPKTLAQGLAHRQGAAAAAEAPVPPNHPLARILAKWENSKERTLQLESGAATSRKTIAFDPMSSSQVHKGTVVPMPDTKVKIPAAGAHGTGLEGWYYKNRELLASRNHRIVIDPDGHMYVGRLFRSKGSAFKYMQFVESHADDLTKGVRYTYETPAAPLEPQLNDVIDEAIRAQEAGVENPGVEPDFDQVIDRVHGHLIKHREGGKGHKNVKSSDGQKFQIPNAYEGHDGDLMRGLVSSQGAIEALSDGHGAALSLLRKNAIGHRAYNPPAGELLKKGTKEYASAVEYFHKWSDLLNTQIAHSPIWSKMLNGWSDERIVRWLEDTPAGAVVRREVMHDDATPELWVNEHRAKLDYYLPSKKHQRLLGKGRLEPSTLRKEIHPDERPSVFGPDIEFLDKRQGAGRVLSFAMDRMWHALGTAPVDAFSRHPFAKGMYDLKMRSLIGSTDSKWLDGDTLARYEHQSRNYAKDAVRRHLWDLTDSTNFTDALRFMAPFWGAQQEAITKWMRIVADRPETVARAFNLQRGVYNNFVMVDENGQPIKRDYLSYHPTDRVIMRIPAVMRHTKLGEALATIGTIGVPLGSANVVLQGESPLLPGPGPVITVSVDKLLRATSDTYGVSHDQNFFYRWMFPIGRPQHGGMRGVLDQVMPGWSKRVMQGSDQDGVAYANLYTETAREMDLDAREKNKPTPTPNEIQHRVDFIWGLRTLTGLISPVQVQYRPKHQFLIDAAHKYQKDFGVDWFDKFMADYGTTVARYATSSSNSPISLPPTSQGMEDWAQNRDLIQEYPQWGGAIVSPDAYKDDFNSDAYYAQFQINLGPGDDTPLRESQSTRERFATADARAGWYEFRKVDAVLDAQLEARGLHSISQTGAEDLALLKKNFVTDLSTRLPAWREEYDNYNNDIYTRVGELEKWAFRPEFDNRPDIQGARQYLMIRDQVTLELDQYAAASGGSRSLQAQENSALRDWFYQRVGQLAQANPAFAEFYSRYLSADTLEQGSGS